MDKDFKGFGCCLKRQRLKDEGKRKMGLWKKKRTHLITRRPAPTEAGTDTPFISSVTAYRMAENLPCSKLSKCAKIKFFEGLGLWIKGKDLLTRLAFRLRRPLFKERFSAFGGSATKSMCGRHGGKISNFDMC